MLECDPDDPPIDPLRITPLVNPVFVALMLVVALGPIVASAFRQPQVPAGILARGGPMLVDVNEADSDLLGVLPGIGPTIAGRIVTHRERFGRFDRPEGLMEVHGIGPKTFERLRRHAVVLDPIAGTAGGQTLAAGLP